MTCLTVPFELSESPSEALDGCQVLHLIMHGEEALTGVERGQKAAQAPHVGFAAPIQAQDHFLGAI